MIALIIRRITRTVVTFAGGNIERAFNHFRADNSSVFVLCFHAVDKIFSFAILDVFPIQIEEVGLIQIQQPHQL
jgi:hypothetical protein